MKTNQFKNQFFFSTLLSIFFLMACGSSSTNNSGNTNAATGTISGSISDSNSSSSVSGSLVKALTIGNGVKVYVVGQDDLYGTTDTNGNFTIQDVPVGSHCIYSSTSDSESGETVIVSRCDITVADSTEASVGNIEAEENTSFSCTTNDDCNATWDLPTYACNSSGSIGSSSSSCGGFLCSGVKEDSTKYCQYSASSTSSSNVCENNAEHFTIHGSGPTGGTITYVRAGPNDTCEVTNLCTSDTDCSAGQSCFHDGYCISQSAITNTASAGCEVATGCSYEGSFRNICVPIASDGNCNGQCFSENEISFTTCSTDEDCRVELSLDDVTCFSTKAVRIANETEIDSSNVNFCVRNDVSACQ